MAAPKERGAHDLGRGSAEKYLVLGTLETTTWRRGLFSGVTVAELIEHMADVKQYMRIDYTPAVGIDPTRPPADERSFGVSTLAPDAGSPSGILDRGLEIL
jgi:hypothetical protein